MLHLLICLIRNLEHLFLLNLDTENVFQQQWNQLFWFSFLKNCFQEKHYHYHNQFHDNMNFRQIKNHFDNLVFNTIIHRNTKLGEAPSFGKPALMYDADSTGATNYLNLAKEILQKNDLTKIKNEDKILEPKEDGNN